MARLGAISSSPTLREYAQGAAQEATQPVADFIAPTVPVPLSVMHFKRYSEKSRFHLPDTRRALGGYATEIRFDVADDLFNCSPHALDFPIDNLERLEESQLEDMMKEGATAIAEISALSHEKSVIDLALAAVGAGTALDLTAGADVIDQIDGDILNVVKAAKYGSLMGVGIVFGATLFRQIKNHPSVRARFGNGRGIIPNVNEEGLSGLFIAKADIKTSYMVYDDSPEGLAENIKFVLDTSMLIFARKEQPTRRDPSFMKTFRLMNHWMVPGSYVRPDERVEVAKYDWSEDIKVTNAAACVRRNSA